MKKIRVLDSLKSKKLRYGGYATLMVVVAIALVIIVTLVMDQLSWKIDMTQQGVFTLSEQTNKVLDELKTDVTITSVTYGGAEDPSMKEFLRRYALRSKRITLQTVDPDLNPQWSKQFIRPGGFLRDGSIVVATPRRFKVIDPYDLSLVSNDINTSAPPQVVSFKAEQLVTSALLYATAEKDVVVYVIQGHGEQNLATLGLSASVANENYKVSYINLVSESVVPVDADILVVIGPTIDFSAEDVEKVRTFIERGGRALLLLDIPSAPSSRPVTDELLKSFGVAMRNLVVVEGDTSRIALNNPIYLLPEMKYHDIMEPLTKANLPVFLPAAQAIETLASRSAFLTIEPLLSTSTNSWGKENYQNLQTLNKEEGDPMGPFTLAVAITQKPSDPARRDGKLVVAGSSLFLRDEFAGTNPGNTEFFLNSVGWLSEKKFSMSIRAKDLSQSRLRISTNVAYVLSGVSVILMPLSILGWGFVVWMRRRHL